MSKHHLKAVLVTILFAVTGVLGWALTVTDWHVSLPLAIFYAVLTINTFPSVHLFSSIAPEEDRKHLASDILLSVLYVFLAFTFAEPVSFALTATLLFIVASGKYAFLLHTVPHNALLKRKIIIDVFGALLCAASLGAMLATFVFEASWTLAVVFAIANVYFLWLKPMYRLGD